jgi:hypothetical protein
MSLTLLYLRVFILRISVRNLIYAIIVATSINSWGQILVTFFQCHPIASNWDPQIKSTCINHYLAFIIGSAVGIFIDIMLIVIILPYVCALRLRKAQKVGLLIVVNLGWVTVLAAIVRTVKVARAVKSSTDFSWSVVEIITWSSVECSTMMVCAAAPVIKPLMKKFAIVMPAGWVTNLAAEGEESFSARQTDASNTTEKNEATSISFVLRP